MEGCRWRLWMVCWPFIPPERCFNGAKMSVGHENQFHRGFQIRFPIDQESDVACLGRPAMRTRLASRQHALLIRFRQSNVAMSAAVDVHEHAPSNKECIFVNSGVWPFRHTRQSEYPVAQFLMNQQPPGLFDRRKKCVYRNVFGIHNLLSFLVSNASRGWPRLIALPLPTLRREPCKGARDFDR